MKYLDSSSNTYKEIYAKPSGDTLPIGSQVPFSSLTIPDNWLLCDGRAISRANYSELFAVIGTTYGAGDGSTTFNIPNKKGRTSVGFDSSQTEFNAVGSSGGSKTHTLTVAEMPSHIHTKAGYPMGETNSWVEPYLRVGYVYSATNPYPANIETSSTGGNQAHNNLQPYQTDVWIIKAKQSAGVVATVVDTLDSTSATNALSANQGKILNDNINSGWINPNETWTYSSVDNPTGVITITGDKTTKYSLGMRIKFTNNSNVIYGIITKISYSSPNTTLTFLHEINPSNSLALHLMANSAITANYYSNMKAPFGFPLNPDKWSVVFTVSSTATSSPVVGTWYNKGSQEMPIGIWVIKQRLGLYPVRATAGDVGVKSTLSTTNNGETHANLSGFIYNTNSTGVILPSVNNDEILILTTKTTFYVNIKTDYTGVTAISFWTSPIPTIKAVCAYL